MKTSNYLLLLFAIVLISSCKSISHQQLSKKFEKLDRNYTFINDRGEEERYYMVSDYILADLHENPEKYTEEQKLGLLKTLNFYIEKNDSKVKKLVGTKEFIKDYIPFPIWPPNCDLGGDWGKRDAKYMVNDKLKALRVGKIVLKGPGGVVCDGVLKDKLFSFDLSSFSFPGEFVVKITLIDEKTGGEININRDIYLR